MLVSCVRQLHYLIKVEFHCLLSLSTTTNMSSTQLPPLHQREIEFLKKVMEGIPTKGNESCDYAETLLWKDEKEFQEVLDYWSSWFRAIHTAKLAKPIEPEFQRSWEQY